MRILAIGAHPDDCEIYCGGTLAKYAKQGHDVFMVAVTNGEVGSTTLPPEEISAIRKKEAAAAAAVIGAEPIWLGFQDQRFLIDDKARLVFVDLFRYVKPDVVISHYPDDYSADHTLVGRMANDIAHLPTTTNIKTEHPTITKVPVHYFFDTPAGVGFLPHQYVDITETMDTKREMIRCHATQESFMEYACGMGIEQIDEITARFRGMQAGVTYAEAYRMVQAWPRMTAGTLLP